MEYLANNSNVKINIGIHFTSGTIVNAHYHNYQLFSCQTEKLIKKITGTATRGRTLPLFPFLQLE
jgi:hypothetical protein